MSSLPQARVGVGVFILSSAAYNPTTTPSNPTFLLGKRLNSHGANTWALPGGHLNFGETFEECAAREVPEETALNVTNVQFLTATNDIMPAENKHYVTIFMVCELEDERQQPEVREPEKCEGWEWVCWEDLERWVKKEGDGEVGERKFVPLLNLVRQRAGVRPGDL